jgi:uncharacterized protein involved in outer membrane biogenesis
MRKPLIIAGSIVGGIVVAIVVILVYAASNLNSLIAQNRDQLLAKVSASLGRTVEVQNITAHLGWGIAADLSGVRIGDDPAFSSKPFVTASAVLAQVEVIPLLARQLRVSKIILSHPEITIIRDADGRLNVMSIGKRSEAPSPAASAVPGGGERNPALGRAIEGNSMPEGGHRKAHATARLGALHVANFSIEQGKIIYQDAGQPPLEVSGIDFNLTNFNFKSPFEVDLRMVALGAATANVELSGQVGPILSGSIIDVNAIPVDLKLAGGPLAMTDLRKLSQLSHAIPPKLAVSDTVTLDATIKGPVNALEVHGETDLTSNQVSFGDSFIKPAGTSLKLGVDARRDGSKFAVTLVKMTLDTLDLKATNITFGGGTFGGRIDTNRFQIGSMAHLLPAAAKLGIAGNAVIRVDGLYADGRTTANGVITLTSVSIPKPGRQPGAGHAVSNLSGDIKLAGSTADIGPMSFNLGGSKATLTAHADPIYPPVLSYGISAESIHPADFVPGRPADEQLSNVQATGNLSTKAFGIDDENKLVSPSGLLNNAPYKDLTLTTSLEGKRVRIMELRVGAFGGQVVATAEAHLTQDSPFSASVAMANLDVQQALKSQKMKAADKVQGILTGNVQVSGKSGKFDQMKQTLNGNGKVELMQGKLVGINVVATALKKVDKLPVIGKLVPDSVVQNHPELFQNPNTDIQAASLSFVLQGPRVTSHDILVKTVDYSLLGDGWVDMDRNIDMAARILLTQALTQEIVAQKQAVMYVTNRNSQIEIPVQITGQIPKPIVVPNVADLAQRASQRALQQQGSKALGKFLGKKGLGGFLGGGSNSGSGGAAEPNPLNNLKKLF